MTEIERYGTRDDLFAGLAGQVAQELASAIANKGRAVLAVPGGTTPAPFFKALRTAPLEWSKIVVMLTDERFVPEISERSNTRLLRANLLQEAAAEATLVPFYKPADAPEEVLADITAGISAGLPLDVCVLGMGADMHTASIFPGADLLQAALEQNAPPVLPMRAPGAPEPRITLTAPVLRQAGSVHVLITGAEKLTALETAMHPGPEEIAPVRVVLNRQGATKVHFAE